MATLAIVLTARPSYARMLTCLDALDPTRVHLVLSGAAMSRTYGDLRADIRQDQHWCPVTLLPTVLEDRTPASMAQTTALTLAHLTQWLALERPSLVVTVADRYETLATAIAASYQGIRVAHVQGGEVSGNIDDRVRDAVTQLADLHLPASESAAARIRSMRPGAEVIVTGCPSMDLAWQARSSSRPMYLSQGVGSRVFLRDPYLVVLQHPVTTHWQQAYDEMHLTIALVESLQSQVLWFWPNIDAGSDGASKALREWRERGPRVPVQFVRHLPAREFLRVLYHADGLIGNSSVGIRECAVLGTPVLNIGDRQRGRERGAHVTDYPQMPNFGQRCDPDDRFGDGRSGARMAAVLMEAT